MRRHFLLVAMTASLALVMPVGGAHADPVQTIQIDPPQAAALLAGTTPARLYDTRPHAATVDGRGSGAGILFTSTTRYIDLVGRGGISNASAAVVLNVVVTGSKSPGFLRLWPCSVPRPVAATLYYAAGQTVANTTIMAIGGSRLCAMASSPTHLVIDLVDQFTAGSGYLPFQRRYVNTSSGLGGGRLVANAWTVFTFPLGAAPGFLQVTAWNPSSAGYLTVQSCPVYDTDPTDPPDGSSVNFAAGRAATNLVAVSDLTRVCVYSSTATDLIIDTVGAYPPPTTLPYAAEPYPIPWRMYDTRWPGEQRLQPGVTFTYETPGDLPLGPVMLFNVTVVGAAAPGYLRVFDCGAVPNTSSVNFGTAPQAHLTFAPASADGRVCFRSSVAIDLVIDASGVFAVRKGPLRATYVSSNGCGATINPAATGYVAVTGNTENTQYIMITNGTGPYTISSAVPSGWTAAATALSGEMLGYANVALTFTHPALADGEYPFPVTITDAVGAQVVTQFTVRVYPYYIVC